MTRRTPRHTSRLALERARWALVCALLLCACSNTESGSGVAPDPSYAVFKADVYPLLLRDCAFSECHGKPERFFQLWGPGRTRLHPRIIDNVNVTTEQLQQELEAETQRSYDRARAMLATSTDVDKSLLLRKPLEPDSGGQGHKGVDEFGRNVYRYKEDIAYVIISNWAHSAAGDLPMGLPTGSAGMGATP